MAGEHLRGEIVVFSKTEDLRHFYCCQILQQTKQFSVFLP